MYWLDLLAQVAAPVTTENPLPVQTVTAAISDTVWLAAILCFQTIVLAVIQLKTKKVVDTTHSLVNSAMTIQLEINRTLSKKLADESPTPENITIAAQAEEKYRQHVAKDMAAAGIMAAVAAK